MSLNWIDVTKLSFNVLLLLERVQLSWFPGWVPEAELRIALKANPAVEWYLTHKCPEIAEWVDKVQTREDSPLSGGEVSTEVKDSSLVRAAEIKVMDAINDLLVYAVNPALYDALPFLRWDSTELSKMTDFNGKIVVDVGSGTGRLAFIAAEERAHAVFAVEPVANLRYYIKEKAKANTIGNIFPVDGTITELPFPTGFADVCMSGHVFGDAPQAEDAEMSRITKPGGMVILCPGNNDKDDGHHDFLISQGYEWSRFEEPEDGVKRKYWRTV